MAVGKKAKKPTLNALEKRADELSAEVADVRKNILQNESLLRRKIAEKMRNEDKLKQLLKKRFAEKKSTLSRIKSTAAKKQARLKQKISSLERINKIYEDKRARIQESKKKYTELKNQLESLENQAGVW